MREVTTLVLAFVAGAALGAIFFGGLWWTIRKGLTSGRPALWFFASMLLRTGIVIAGLYFVSNGHWQRLVSCLVGFVLARLIVTRLTHMHAEKQARFSEDANHAP